MRRNRVARLTTALALVPALALATAEASAQERHGLGASHVAIYNLAGSVDVHGTSGGQVTVEISRGGRDAERLKVETGDVGGRRTLRVIYPSDRVVYNAPGWRGNTTLRVRSNGTWGGERASGGGRSVRVASSGRGTEAHANLRIGVPRGQRVDIYLAVGRITAENVDGHVRLDTHSGGVAARGMSGHLTIDTGSGSVEVAGMRGDLHVDTGSGSVRVSDVTDAGNVVIDTGSGRVSVDGLSTNRLVIDTGSGGIDLRRGTARDARLDTGSGSVNAELAGPIDRLLVDTGSGSVTLALSPDVDARLEVDTGSGGITVDLPLQVTRRARSELQGVLGQGRGSIRVDTGSGSVRIRAL